MGMVFSGAGVQAEHNAVEVLGHWQRDYTRRILAESRKLYLSQQHHIGKQELLLGSKYASRRNRLLKQVREAGVAAMLLQPEEMLRIYDALPRIAKTLAEPYRPKDIEGMLALLTNNLDWYLSPGRLLTRKRLHISAILSLSGLLVLAIIALIKVAGMMGSPGYPIWPMLGNILLFVIVLATSPWRHDWRNFLLISPQTPLHADVLHEYFKTLLADEEPVTREELTAIIARHRIAQRRKLNAIAERDEQVATTQTSAEAEHV